MQNSGKRLLLTSMRLWFDAILSSARDVSKHVWLFNGFSLRIESFVMFTHSNLHASLLHNHHGKNESGPLFLDVLKRYYHLLCSTVWFRTDFCQ